MNDLIDRKSSLSRSSSSTSDLKTALAQAQKETFDALCDSFNTRKAMFAITDLISTVYSIGWRTVDRDDIISVAKWVTEMVNMFGLIDKESTTSTSIGWSSSSIPEEAKPFVYPLSDLRDQLRRKARSKEGITTADLITVTQLEQPVGQEAGQTYSAIATKFAKDVSDLATSESESLSKSVLELCDRLRDVDLWEEGIYLEDGFDAAESAIIRPVTQELRMVRERREQEQLDKQNTKEERQRRLIEETLYKAVQGKTSHLQMFRTSEYTEWDADGLPTKDTEGKQVSKSRSKKLRKEWERQKKFHEAYLASQQE